MLRLRFSACFVVFLGLSFVFAWCSWFLFCFPLFPVVFFTFYVHCFSWVCLVFLSSSLFSHGLCLVFFIFNYFSMFVLLFSFVFFVFSFFQCFLVFSLFFRCSVFGFLAFFYFVFLLLCVGRSKAKEGSPAPGVGLPSRTKYGQTYNEMLSGLQPKCTDQQ